MDLAFGVRTGKIPNHRQASAQDWLLLMPYSDHMAAEPSWMPGLQELSGAGVHPTRRIR